MIRADVTKFPISPPGDTIRDLLEEKGWTQAELSDRTGFSAKHINDLIHARVAITADAAPTLARALGSTPNFWLVREANYQAAIAKQQQEEALGAYADWLAELPAAWMRKRGWLTSGASSGRQVDQGLHFFGVSSVEAWRTQYERPLAAWRSHMTASMKLGSISVWLRYAEKLAERIETKTYGRAAFRDALPELRSLSRVPDPKRFVPKLRSICASFGVAVVFVPHPPGCPVSGATRWLSPEKAMLALSLRHKTNDHLWFSFFHEAAHILLHGKKMQFIEGIKGLDAVSENEADIFAKDLLIPPSEMPALLKISTKAAALAAAERLGVAPGVVVGRLQREGVLPWSHLNDLKDHYRWNDSSD